MIQASEDENDRFIGFLGLTNLGVGCISRAVTVEGDKILRRDGRTHTDRHHDQKHNNLECSESCAKRHWTYETLCEA